MSNQNGRIYIDTSTTPHKGISIADIQTVLGSQRNDIGGLITYGNINVFAKNKPIRKNTLGVITDADRRLALWGVAMTQVGRVNYPQNYSVPWGYNRPRGKGGGTMGYDEWFRFLDFDGYQHGKWPETKNERMLTTIFNGQMEIPGATVGALDTISFSMQCRENPEIDENLGLIYPYDFDGADYPYDIADYYLGIAIIDNINGSASTTRNVWVISGPRISDHFNLTNYDVYANMYAHIPANVSNSELVIAPVLLENNTVPSGESEPAWTTGYNGTIVNLNGAYFSAMKHADNMNLRITFTNVSIGASSISFTVSVQNVTGDVVRVNNLVGYLLSYDARWNEHSSRPSYSGRDYVGIGASGYIYTEWPNYKQGDIYTHDWTGEPENPDELGARYVVDDVNNRSLLQAFYVANNNSYDLGDNITRTFSITMSRNMVLHGFVGDDFGPYVDGAFLLIGLHAGTFNTMRDYQIIE